MTQICPELEERIETTLSREGRPIKTDLCDLKNNIPGFNRVIPPRAKEFKATTRTSHFYENKGYLIKISAVETEHKNLLSEFHYTIERFNPELVEKLSNQHNFTVRSRGNRFENNGITVEYTYSDFIEGKPLSEVIKSSPKTSEELIDRLYKAIQCVDAVEDLRNLDLIHRDIKPDNFMIDKNSKIYLADFELMQPNSPHVLKEDHSINEKMCGDSPVGTPIYMSDEGMRNNKISHQEDIYAMGISTLEILLGEISVHGEQKIKEKHWIREINTVEEIAGDKKPVVLIGKKEKTSDIAQFAAGLATIFYVIRLDQKEVLQVFKENCPSLQKYKRHMKNIAETIITATRDSKDRYTIAQEMSDDLKKTLKNLYSQERSQLHKKIISQEHLSDSIKQVDRLKKIVTSAYKNPEKEIELLNTQVEKAIDSQLKGLKKQKTRQQIDTLIDFIERDYNNEYETQFLKKLKQEYSTISKSQNPTNLYDIKQGLLAYKQNLNKINKAKYFKQKEEREIQNIMQYTTAGTADERVVGYGLSTSLIGGILGFYTAAGLGIIGGALIGLTAGAYLGYRSAVKWKQNYISQKKQQEKPKIRYRVDEYMKIPA